MTPEEQFDGALALIWLCQKAGVLLEAEGEGPAAKIVMRVENDKFPEEFKNLLRPYKLALLTMLRFVRHDLQKQVYRDIEEAMGSDDVTA